MPVSQWGSYIQIVHAGEGSEATARSLVAEIRRKVGELPEGRLVLFHDATHLESANQEYAVIFAGLMRELPKSRVLQVAAVPKAWMRVLAKTASVLGGLDMHIFKTTDEAHRYLTEQGFSVPAVNAA